MNPMIQTFITVVCAVLASSGFWAFIQRKKERKDAKTKLLIGLAHDRIMAQSLKYLERGFVTKDEYEDLHIYLYGPYCELGGNGSAERIVSEVDKLPIQNGRITD